MLAIDLTWNGPFAVATPEQRAGFTPPTTGGVYIWCVGRHPARRVCYVGEAANLQARMYEHIFWTLGGAYDLFSDAHLIEGEPPAREYTPGLQNILSVFLADPATYSKKALHNLYSYSFFWAVTSDDKAIRQSVESALILEARKQSQPLQNWKITRASQNSPRMTIFPSFPPGTQPGADSTKLKLDYGRLD